MFRPFRAFQRFDRFATAPGQKECVPTLRLREREPHVDVIYLCFSASFISFPSSLSHLSSPLIAKSPVCLSTLHSDSFESDTVLPADPLVWGWAGWACADTPLSALQNTRGRLSSSWIIIQTPLGFRLFLALICLAETIVTNQNQPGRLLLE